MEREIERKFSLKYDVSKEYSHIVILETLLKLDNKCEILDGKTATRSFVYYDTPEKEFYKTGCTLRRRGIFNEKFKYDWKTGKMDERMEGTHEDGILSCEEISKQFDLAQVEPILHVDYSYVKNTLKVNETTIESSLDTVYFEGKKLFQEWEFEIKSGREMYLNVFCEKFLLNPVVLTEEYRQKYTKIINILEEKNGI